MNTLLQCNMHIICCIRAREKTDFKNPDKPVSLGIQPVCEKNFMFEMTASLLMEDEGKKQTFLKMPEFLRSSFGDGKSYLSKETGLKIINWISQGEQEDPEITRIKSEMTMSCEFGLAGLNAVWNKLTPNLKKKLVDHKNICKASAEEYQDQAKQAEQSPQEELADRMSQNGSTKTVMP